MSEFILKISRYSGERTRPRVPMTAPRRHASIELKRNERFSGGAGTRFAAATALRL
jgi:hypothetical protein